MEMQAKYVTKPHYTLTPAQADDLGARVFAILADHRGAATAITGRAIALSLGMGDDRDVRTAIQQLIGVGQPIAASTRYPFGYYLITDRDEAEAYERALRSRAVKTLKRLADFHKAANKMFGSSYQMPLPSFAIQKTIEGLER